jgi:hypothetical protein
MAVQSSHSPEPCGGPRAARQSDEIERPFTLARSQKSDAVLFVSLKVIKCPLTWAKGTERILVRAKLEGEPRVCQTTCTVSSLRRDKKNYLPYSQPNPEAILLLF